MTSKLLADLHRSEIARTTTITVRLQPEMRALIDAAASALGQTRQAYIVDSLHLRSTSVLLDQRVFEVSESSAADVLHDALAAPPPPAHALVQLLRSRSDG